MSEELEDDGWIEDEEDEDEAGDEEFEEFEDDWDEEDSESKEEVEDESCLDRRGYPKQTDKTNQPKISRNTKTFFP
jgi:hypothetical protein